MGKVKEDFLTGPKDPVTGQRKLKPDGKPQEPYNEVMNAEITRLQAEIEKSIKRRDEENDKWVSALSYGTFEEFLEALSHILTYV